VRTNNGPLLCAEGAMECGVMTPHSMAAGDECLKMT
jgi:hypothetical protein